MELNFYIQNTLKLALFEKSQLKYIANTIVPFSDIK